MIIYMCSKKIVCMPIRNAPSVNHSSQEGGVLERGRVIEVHKTADISYSTFKDCRIFLEHIFHTYLLHLKLEASVEKRYKSSLHCIFTENKATVFKGNQHNVVTPSQLWFHLHLSWCSLFNTSEISVKQTEQEPRAAHYSAELTERGR